uniref:Putative secreted protein n=1 Tax=Amblyomma triste TaxID=251400 RepID=A0A023G100_AMBTT
MNVAGTLWITFTWDGLAVDWAAVVDAAKSHCVHYGRARTVLRTGCSDTADPEVSVSVPCCRWARLPLLLLRCLALK